MIPRAPTPTEDFARCPIYARLNREWEPRGAEWTPNMLLGRAIGDGMTQCYRNTQDPAFWADDSNDPLQTALDALQEGFVEQDTWSIEALRKLVTTGLREALQTTPVQGTILMVDESLPSRARPDVVFRHPSAGLTVVDTKVRFKLDSRYREKALAEYETWWQGFHYAWEVGEVLREPVKYIGPHLITLTPKVSGVYHPIEVTPERVAFWHRQAETVWRQMPASRDPLGNPIDPPPLSTLTPNWFSCHGKYGRCFAYDACHTCHLDEDRMSILYQRKRSEGKERL